MNKATHVIAAAAILLALAANGAQAAEPPLASMRLAQPGQKLGAPVDLRYLVSGTVGDQATAAVDLAVVPRIEGTNLEIEVVPSEVMRVVADKRSVSRVAKAEASATYRQSLEVTPLDPRAGLLQVIVTMDVGDASYASLYNIALAGPAAQKPDRRQPAK